MKNLYLVIGASGTGKTTVAKMLCREHGMTEVVSYTTRPKRSEGETGHIFVSDTEFDKLGELCAYTEYNGYRYGVTKDILDNADLYVIDPDGAEYLRKNYGTDRQIRTIWLDAGRATRTRRMAARGDDDSDIAKRLMHDAYAFSVDKMINVMYEDDLYLATDYLTADEVADRFWGYIQAFEPAE